MKFGAKILICNLIVMLILFGIGGGLLVWHSYELAVEREVDSGLEENQLLRSAMEISALKYVSLGVEDDSDIIKAAAKDMTYGIKGTRASVYLLDWDGELLYGNSDAAKAPVSLKALTDNLEIGKKNYEIGKLNGRYHLYTAGRTDLNGHVYYLISVRDIHGVYENIQRQFNYYRLVLIALVAACSVLLFIILRYLTRSIRALDASTEQIMSGDYAIQVNVHAHDEIGALSDKFNRMARAIADHIHEVEEEGRRREEFVANFTHELKTPMTTIIGYADMIRSKNLSDDLRFEAANYIVEEGIRLENMSARLFDLFIAENDDIQMSPVPVPELLDEVHKSVEPLLEKKRLELHVDCEPAYVMGDKEMLRSVFINLIDNAIKASESDSIITVTGHNIGGGQVRMEITDQGCGIPDGEVDKIKEAFYMVDKSRARKAGGAGLGLAFAGKVLELHQVHWEILSEVDIGTSIIMDFKEGKAHGPMAEIG